MLELHICGRILWAFYEVNRGTLSVGTELLLCKEAVRGPSIGALVFSVYFGRVLHWFQNTKPRGACFTVWGNQSYLGFKYAIPTYFGLLRL